MTQRYTAQAVKAAVEPNIEQLIKPWPVGRPATWVADPGTKALIATGYWLREELIHLCAYFPLSLDDVRTQCWKYNRDSRSYDIWETAAECLNDALDGKVEQNRRGHRRWG